MRLRTRFLAAFALLALIPACATVQSLAALRSVTFAFERVSDLRLAGVRISPGMGFSDLGLADAARITAAIVTRSVPLELVGHVDATNPRENRVEARMVALDWKLFVNDKSALSGRIAEPVVIAPGQTADIPVRMELDLMQVGTGGARDLFDLAMGIAGEGNSRQEVHLELVPTIETSIGPMRFPGPIVVRRAPAPR